MNQLDWSMEEVRSHWNWARGSSFLNNSKFSFTWWLCTGCVAPLQPELQSVTGRHARMFSLRQWLRINGLTRLLLLRMSSPVLGSCWRVDSFIKPRQLVLLDVGYIEDNVLPQIQGEKHVLFLAILAIARMVIWTTRKKELYDNANFSHCDLILFFRHQLRVKIRCDRQKVGA